MKILKSILLSALMAVTLSFSTALAAEGDFQITASKSANGTNVSVLDAEINTPTPAYFRLQGTAASPATNDALFYITVTTPSSGATATLIATDTAGNQYDVAKLGYWGPPTGFYIDSTTDNLTLFTGTFDTAGAYSISVQLKKVSTGEILGSKTVTVNVKDSTQISQIPVTNKLIITPSTATLKPGETVKLTAVLSDGSTENPATEVKWSSNSEDIAQVSTDGTVTAKSAGTATITGTDAGSGTTASMTVLVENLTPDTGDSNILFFVIIAMSAVIIIVAAKTKKTSK